MAYGTAVTHGSKGDLISHFTGVRLRVQGLGNLGLLFSGLDDVEQLELVEVPMNPIPGREPTRLANFQNQRASIEFFTDEINEQFTVYRVIVFAKPLWSSYPGTE